MKITLSVIIFFSFLSLSFSQAKHDYVWLSGYCFGCEEPLDSFSTSVLDFNNEELIPYQDDEITMTFDFTVGYVCDAEGNLLFYTNGCRIINAENTLMENGDSLNYNDDEWWLQCDPEVVSIDALKVNKGLMILPKPDNDSLFYIFHYPIHTLSSGAAVLSLQYTVVNMAAAGGLGAVVEKNVPVVEDTLHNSLMAAVKHANGHDWWILSTKRNSNLYYRALFTAEGVSEVFTQNVGDTVIRSGGSGQAVFSPDGTKYASYTDRNQCYLMDFDNATGEFSDFRRLTVRDTSLYPGGVTFSPSSRYLYVSSNDYLHQFDTEAADVQASRVEIAEYDGEKVHGWPTRYFTMQLAPDCRIYMISTNAVPAMHVIHHPDQPGLDCGFDQNGLRLPTFNSFSQPNFPNYRLGTPYPVCDSTIQLVSSTVRVLPPTEQVRLWPNPASGAVNVELPRPLATVAEWRLFSGTGALVREAVLPAGQVQYAADVSGLPGGLYFWELRSEGARIGSGKLVLE